MNIEQLIKQYPNDSELGNVIRTTYYQNKKEHDKLMKEMKGKKIFESPDKGYTIYERDFGTDFSERKLIKNQLTIFDDEAYKES